MPDPQGSPRFSLSSFDWQKVTTGAAVAGAGAALGYFTQWASGQDFGPWSLIVGAVLSTLANLVKKWSTDTRLVVFLAVCLTATVAQAADTTTVLPTDFTLQGILAWLTTGPGIIFAIGLMTYLAQFPAFSFLGPIATLVRTLHDSINPPAPVPPPTPAQAIQALSQALQEAGESPDAIKAALSPFSAHALGIQK